MNKVTQLIKARLKKRQHQPNINHRLFSSGRDWLIGLGFFLVVVLSGSYASAYIFMQYNEISVAPTETTTALPRYNQQGVADVLSAYQGRAERYQTLKQGTRFTPPALPEPVVVSSTTPTTTEAVPEVLSPVPAEPLVEVSVPVLE